MTTTTALVRTMNPTGCDQIPPPLAAMGEFTDGSRLAPHQRRHAQLVHVQTGVLRVTTATGAWTVPPFRALWIPPETLHEIRMIGGVTMQTLDVEPHLGGELWAECRVIEVKGLLKALLLQVLDQPPDRASGERGGLMIKLVLHELKGAAPVPLHLPMPRDQRLLKICRALIEHPESDDTLAGWAKRASASARTVARLFQAETGLSFGVWRQHLRLAEALCRLISGRPVAEVASGLGYRSASAFIAMFRRALGETPHRYLRSPAGD
jgi:AraC-like DNA-binding protein